MLFVELSAGLALLAAMLSGLQAVAVEYGLTEGSYTEQESPALAAAVISVVVSVAVFWTLVTVRDVSFEGATVAELAPFAVAGLANPAAFRLLYFRSIDRIGARVSAAVVCANPALAAVLAVPLFGEQFTLLSGLGLLCIVGGAVVLQVTQAGDDSAEGDLLLDELSAVDAEDVAVPLIAMVMLGVSFVLVEYGLSNYGNSLVGTAVGQTAALIAFAALFGVSDNSWERVGIGDQTGLAAFTPAGAFVAGNWLAWFSALRLGTVVTVAPLANTYPLFVVAVSYLLVRQVPRSPRVISGIVAIVAGASLMQLA